MPVSRSFSSCGKGKRIVLANFSFTFLRGTSANELTPSLFEVCPDTTGEDTYFPERQLCRFLRSTLDVELPIFCFESSGVKVVREAYRYLQQRFKLDTVILVDGGTDILLRGDEANLGTPAEDMVSLAAVNCLDLKTSLVMCVGFGVDSYHGVCHANWLENVAHLTSEGAFLGAIALTAKMPR